jgi:hypothetical protein
MSPADLMAEAWRRGVLLSAHPGGRLRYDAPAGAMTDDLRAALTANKPAILDLLTAEAGGAVGAAPGFAPGEGETSAPSARSTPGTSAHGTNPNYDPGIGETVVVVGAPPQDRPRSAPGEAEIGPAPPTTAASAVAEGSGQAEWLNALGAWAAGQDEYFSCMLEARAEVDLDFDATAYDPTPRPQPWRCENAFCRDKSRWWISIYNTIQCLNCRAPSFPDLIRATGDLVDAPLVKLGRSTTPILGGGAML